VANGPNIFQMLLVDYSDGVDCVWVCVRQLRKQNVELKRRSQQLLEKMQIVDIDLEDIDQVDSVSDSNADEDNTLALNKQILCNYHMLASQHLLCRSHYWAHSMGP